MFFLRVARSNWRSLSPVGLTLNGTICRKAEEVAWWMEALGSFLRVLNVLPREKIEGPPRDFLKAKPRPHPRPDQRPKNPRGCRPRGFLAFGLAEDVANGLPLENPKGDLQYSSEGVHWVLDGSSEGSIQHDTSEDFPQIFILFTLRTCILRETRKTHKQNIFQWNPREYPGKC